MISLDDLSFELPREHIAQRPVRPRDSSRLLVLEGDELREQPFRALADDVGPDDLVVVNDTRVVPAKLRGNKASGGRAEALLIERRPDGTWTAFVKCGGRLRAGLALRFGEAAARVLEVWPDGTCRLEVAAAEDWLTQTGEAPLPPYIERAEPLASDLADYQSIFSQHPGAIAAPTASLHFTPELAARLNVARVTLHVGPGTFKPVRGELASHALEAERFEVPAETARAIEHTRAAGGRVIAVGTTVVRALETTGGAAGAGRTDLFITPGFQFRVTDELVTNFHLPGSTLLALVMAFAGVERTRRAYECAIAEKLRFYSYGDAMWVR